MAKNDYRELFNDNDEMLRVLVDAVRARMHKALPAIVHEDSDGQTVKLKVAIKSQTRDRDGKPSHIDYPFLETVPVHFVGGGAKDEDSVVLTHPVKVAKKQQQQGKEEKDYKKSDEGMIVFSDRPLDNWYDKADSQEAIDRRQHGLSDAMFIPGWRSKPRTFKHFDNKTAQLRSIDKKHVVCHDPHAGTTIKSVEKAQDKKQGETEDPDPYEKPKDYFQSFVQAKGGVNLQGTKDEGDKDKVVNHRRVLTHDGHVTSFGKPGKDNVHTVATNDSGVKVAVDAASEPKHTLHVKSGDSGGVFSKSSKTVDVDAPTHNVNAKTNIKGETHVIEATSGETKLKGKARTTDDHTFEKNVNVQQILKAAQAQIGSLTGSGGGGAMNSGGGANSGVGAGAMQDGAASTNVGALGGDLSGTLPNPNVIGITHIINAHLLVDAADDTAAATAGVGYGMLYRNGSVLMVMMDVAYKVGSVGGADAPDVLAVVGLAGAMCDLSPIEAADIPFMEGMVE